MVVISTRKVLEVEAMFLQALTLFALPPYPSKMGTSVGTYKRKWFIVALIPDLWWMWNNIG